MCTETIFFQSVQLSSATQNGETSVRRECPPHPSPFHLQSTDPLLPPITIYIHLWSIAFKSSVGSGGNVPLAVRCPALFLMRSGNIWGRWQVHHQSVDLYAGRRRLTAGTSAALAGWQFQHIPKMKVRWLGFSSKENQLWFQATSRHQLEVWAGHTCHQKAQAVQWERVLYT